MTNNHVVSGDRATVTLPTGTSVPARTVQRDPHRDLLALQVDVRGLRAIQRGDSLHTQVGQWVLAVGNPLGMRGVVTDGIITGVVQVAGPDRTWLDDLIQADVTLAPGNSGGPLADAAGRLLGSNSLVAASGVALAVPTHAVEAFLSPQPNARAFLGVTGVEVRLQLQSQVRGALVLTTVEEHGPAGRSGVLQGDILIRVDGQETGSGAEPHRTLSIHSTEEPLVIEVLRTGQLRQFTIMPALRAVA